MINQAILLRYAICAFRFRFDEILSSWIPLWINTSRSGPTTTRYQETKHIYKNKSNWKMYVVVIFIDAMFCKYLESKDEIKKISKIMSSFKGRGSPKNRRLLFNVPSRCNFSNEISMDTTNDRAHLQFAMNMRSDFIGHLTLDNKCL